MLLYIGCGSALRSCCESLSLQNAFTRQTGQPSRKKEKEEVGIGELERGEAYECINSLQKLEFNLRGTRKFRRQKGSTTKELSFCQPTSQLVRQQQAKSGGSLLPFDERFPTFSVATDERMAGSLYFSLCRGCRQTLPRHSAILSVIEPLCDTPLQTPSTSKTLHYSVCPSQPVLSTAVVYRRVTPHSC